MSRLAGTTCSWVQRRLSPLLGDDLERGEDRRVRSHLRACTRCRAELGAWMKVRGALASLATGERFDRRFFAELERDVLARVDASGNRIRRPVAGGRGLFGWIASGIAAGLLFAIGLSVGRGAPPRPGEGLLDLGPVTGSTLPVYDPSSVLRPVGFPGLKGRERVHTGIHDFGWMSPEESARVLRLIERWRLERERR